jgi:competence protein ComEA
MKKKYKTIGIGVLLFFVLVYLIISYLNGGSKELNKNNDESIFVEDEEEKSIAIKNKEIVVEIKGEVKKPDIYWMKEDSIIEDLINEAGGITEEADISGINRAELLKNHQSIVIPNIKEGDVVTNSTTSGVNKDGKININTATVGELDTLPGIGPARAADIISYREENGGFKSIEDIKNIKGIGESSFEKLKDKITI